MTRSTATILTMLACAATATSAMPQGEAPLRDASPVLTDWRVPIHTAEADPVFGEYGTWAVGPDYKVSFHDGFAFYPYLGAGYAHNLPVRWRTESITMGEATLVDSAVAAAHHHTDWRYEYRYGPVTEAYDVLPAGVEQTFVVHRPPARGGDLVVRATMDTELCAKAQAAEHAPLTFCDAGGKAIVEYGAAVAIDARGRRAPVATAFDGRRVELRLGGAWLREATYPVVIDPLTTAVQLDSSSSPTNPGNVIDSDVVCSSWPVTGSTPNLIVHSREFAGGDLDAYGHVASDDLRSRILIWSDVATTWSAIRPRCAEVGWNTANLHWVIAYQRTRGTTSQVWVYAHTQSNLTLNSGRMRAVSSASNLEEYRPDIGGTAGGNSSPLLAVMVFEQRAAGTTGPSGVYGVLFDPIAATLGSPFLLTSDGNLLENRTSPSITKMASAPSTWPWVVAWQEKSTTGTDDWDLVVNRVHVDGSIDVDTEVGPAASSGVDALFPIVSGDRTLYLVLYNFSESSVSFRGTGYQRFDWDEKASRPTLGKIRTRSYSPLFPRFQQAVAFDWVTSSHWAIVYRAGTTMEVQRVGYSGGVVESVTIPAQGSGLVAGGVAFSWREPGFLVTYSAQDLLFPLYGRYLDYGNAAVQVYGTSCGGHRITAPGTTPDGSQPHAGHRFFKLYVDCSFCGAKPLFMLAAAGAGAQTLPYGGCQLLIDPATMFVASVLSPTGPGPLNVSVPIPDDPLFIGDVYFQFAYVVGGRIETSNAAIVKVR